MGKSFKDLSSEYHTDSGRIRKLLIKNNIKIRGYGHHLAKYFPDDYDPNNKDYVFTKKKCVECNIDKPLNEFHSSKRSALGVKPICKQCRHEMKDIESAKRTEKYNNDPEYRRKTREDSNRRARTKPYREKARKYFNKLRKTPSHRIRTSLHARLKNILKGIGTKKSAFLKEYIGLSHKEFLKYLESTWTEGMNWNNYGFGPGKWVMDHIIPCCAFDLTVFENQKKCYHYTNIRALWWKDNNKKTFKLENGQDARKVYGIKNYQKIKLENNPSELSQVQTLHSEQNSPEPYQNYCS